MSKFTGPQLRERNAAAAAHADRVRRELGTPAGEAIPVESYGALCERVGVESDATHATVCRALDGAPPKRKR